MNKETTTTIADKLKHNGWTNYATWRVNLEVFDELEISERCTGEWCRDYMRDILDLDWQERDGLTLDFALAFIDSVNWFEIAAHLNERFKK